jgi:hypothetical protein
VLISPQQTKSHPQQPVYNQDLAGI